MRVPIVRLVTHDLGTTLTKPSSYPARTLRPLWVVGEIMGLHLTASTQRPQAESLFRVPSLRPKMGPPPEDAQLLSVRNSSS